MRVKILNAFAQGLPMVSTTVGCEGIHVTDNYDILVADTPEDFAKQTIRLLTDSALNEQLTLHGRQTAEQKYDYRRACAPLDQIYA
jgi:glycosyltransferase involved in cell wall biosynthesis